MKHIYLVAFRGIGFHDAKLMGEPAYIGAGHVGIVFEGYEDHILGFHPTAEAVDEAGGEDEAVVKLKAGDWLPGVLQQDYAMFTRAEALAQHGLRTAVWQFTIEQRDSEFERIHEQTLTWYHEAKLFTYGFALGVPLDDRDNSATFPRRLGLPQFDPGGRVSDYVRILARLGGTWKPKSQQHL